MRLSTEVRLPLPREDVFPFFADAANLQALTPDFLHFRILTPLPIRMEPGALIDYRIRLHGVPVSWRTKITRWDPPHCFVDEQLRGPYRRWVHTHAFIDDGTGTIVRDDVEFEVPFGWLANPFVARDLRKVFTFRQEALLRHFGRPAEPGSTIVITR